MGGTLLLFSVIYFIAVLFFWFLHIYDPQHDGITFACFICLIGLIVTIFLNLINIINAPKQKGIK